MLDLSVLPQFTRGQISALNSLRWLLGTLQLTTADGQVQISEITESASLNFIAPIQFVLRCKYGTFILTVETVYVESMLDHLVKSWRDENEALVPFGWWLTYLVDLFTVLTPLADAQVGFQLSEVKVPGGNGKAPALYGRMKCIGQTWPFAIALLETVYSKPIPRPKRDTTTIQYDLPVIVELSVGRLRLMLSTVQSLKPGDLLLIDRAPSEGVHAELTLNRHISWSGLVSDAGMFYVQSPSKETLGMEFGEDISIEITNGETKAELAPADFSSLPMNLDFHLCRKTLPLLQVSNLAPGMILDLRLDLRDPVTIRVNEQAVGTGQLVQIGDSIGIQIDSWRGFSGQL
jgi:type III secretion system YscQ/HrcQ family protein